jgi:PPK2 family polyphosphate:nucleotide phosphotransferase
MNFISNYKVEPGIKFHLNHFSTLPDGGFKSEEEIKEKFNEQCSKMIEYQDYLMAHENYGLLLIFQGMDAAGKDSLIRYIFSNFDPQGLETKMFKAPSAKELKHDYLWRAAKAIPARGQIGIFNRSYYEHVLLERVHKEKLDRWTLPGEAKVNIWVRIFSEINNFEDYLYSNGIHVLKFYLHLSKEKQREKLLERIERPDKRWKFTMTDVNDRKLWEKYISYYEDAISNTNKKNAPWYIIPDDNKWFARLSVIQVIIGKLKSLHTSYPELSAEQMNDLKRAKQMLEKEG